MTKKTQHAVSQFLESLGVDVRGDMRKTPKRVADLWREHLLAGEGADLGKILRGGLKSEAKDPVCITEVGVHLVCPHHLTVAFGHAHLAYCPDGRIASFGALGNIIAACTARLVLQEDATQTISDAIVEHLGAKACVANINATHPCHNVTHPRAHRAQIVTWASSGNGAKAGATRRTLERAIDGGAQTKRRPRR